MLIYVHTSNTQKPVEGNLFSEHLFMYLSACMCTMCSQEPAEVRKASDPHTHPLPGTGVTNGCGVPDAFWKRNLSPLQEPQAGSSEWLSHLSSPRKEFLKENVLPSEYRLQQICFLFLKRVGAVFPFVIPQSSSHPRENYSKTASCAVSVCRVWISQPSMYCSVSSHVTGIVKVRACGLAVLTNQNWPHSLNKPVTETH